MIFSAAEDAQVLESIMYHKWYKPLWRRYSIKSSQSSSQILFAYLFHLVESLPREQSGHFIISGKNSVCSHMGLVSVHTCTENDSIKEALKSGFLSMNYITIRFDGPQPRTLIGMRMLAIIQHLDLTEQRHEGSSSPTGEWRDYSYRPLCTPSVDYTADSLTLCLSSHYCGPVEQKGDGNRCTVRPRQCEKEETEHGLAGICENAVIVQKALVVWLWTFTNFLLPQFEDKMQDKLLVKLIKDKRENSTNSKKATQRKSRCDE